MYYVNVTKSVKKRIESWLCPFFWLTIGFLSETPDPGRKRVNVLSFILLDSSTRRAYPYIYLSVLYHKASAFSGLNVARYFLAAILASVRHLRKEKENKRRKKWFRKRMKNRRRYDVVNNPFLFLCSMSVHLNTIHIKYCHWLVVMIPHSIGCFGENPRQSPRVYRFQYQRYYFFILRWWFQVSFITSQFAYKLHSQFSGLGSRVIEEAQVNSDVLHSVPRSGSPDVLGILIPLLIPQFLWCQFPCRLFSVLLVLPYFIH